MERWDPADGHLRWWAQRGGTPVAAWLLLVALGAALLAIPSLQHWFIIPCLICALLLLPDAVAWTTGTVDLLSARGVTAMYGLHFFFLAPLVHVATDHWLPYVTPPADWRQWLGIMACLNALGLALYRITAAGLTKRRLPLRPRQLNRRRAWLIIPLASILAGGLQLWLFAFFGGVSGLASAFQSRDRRFEGTGWLIAIAESLPILLVLAYALLPRRSSPPSWASLGGLLALVFMLKVLSAGLRGSRSAVIFPMVLAVGMLHSWVRPVSRRQLLIGAIFAVVFLYVFGFYKAVGTDAVAVIADAAYREDVAQAYGRTLAAAMAGDLGRADIQAYLLYRYWDEPAVFPRAMGATYWAALLSVIPRALIGERPYGKVLFGTEALFGSWRFNPSSFSASNVYGLTGELLLNFGPLAIPIGFVGLAYLVARVDAFRSGLSTDDPRRLLVGGFVLSVVVFLSADADNLLVFIVTQVAASVGIVYLCSYRGAPGALPLIRRSRS